MRAMTWPRSTLSLKSTRTSVTWPETWLPTVTVEIALSVPVAEIATRISPPSTVVVLYPAASPASRCCHHHAAATTRTTATAAIAPLRRSLGRFRGIGSEPAIAGSLDDQRMAVKAVDTTAARPRSGQGVAEPDADHRPLPRAALDADRPAEAFAQATHDRQAHALARVPVGLGAVERIENALQDVGAHADAGIGHGHPVGLDPDLDAPALGERAGIGQQVAQHDREHPRRRMQYRLGGAHHRQLHGPAGQQRAHVLDLLGHHVADRELFALRLDAPFAGEDQERVDHRFHVAAGELDPGQRALRSLGQVG